MSHTILTFQGQCVAARLLMTVFILLLAAIPCRAQDVTRVTSALTVSFKGKVEAIATDISDTTLKKTTTKTAGAPSIEAGGKLSTGADASASVILGGVGTARLGPNTVIQIPDPKTEGHSLELLKGQLFLNISADELKKRKAGEFRLKTPVALLAVKGTKFFAISEKGADTLGVHEGSVSVTEPVNKNTVTIEAGQAVSVSQEKITEPRPFTETERGYTVQYDGDNLVRTPLALVVPQGTNAQVLRDGKLLALTTAEYAHLPEECEYVIAGRLLRAGNRPESAPRLGVNGGASYSLNYTSSDMGSSTVRYNTGYQIDNKLHVKGVVWRAKYAASGSIGPPVAMPFKVRCKNVAKVSFEILSKLVNSGKTKPVLTLYAPATLPADGIWSADCLVPTVFEKTGEDTSHELKVSLYPVFPEGKVDKNFKSTTVFEMTDFVLLSQSK